ncbi:unnamed protein product [Oreochromis niloticus]|nr:unnamed protein product [Mustela putorius furo]
MARAMENPHLKTFDSETNSHVSTDSSPFMFRPISVPLPPRPPPVKPFGHCGKHRSSTVLSVDDEEEHLMPKRTGLMSCPVPLPPSPSAAEKKYACLGFPEHERSELMPLSVLANIPLPPSPTPSPVNDDNTDLKCTSPLAHEVPLPPSPPPVEALDHCAKHRSSTVLSVDDEEEHLMPKRTGLMSCPVPLPPSPSAAEKKYACLGFPEHERSESMPLSVLANIPLPPSPPPSPVNDDNTDLKCTCPLAHEVPLPPSPPPIAELGHFRNHGEIPHLPEKKYLHLSTVAFPCLDD